MNIFDGWYAVEAGTAQPARNALVRFTADAAGIIPITTYDLHGNEIELRTNDLGYLAQFGADAVEGYLQFGEVPEYVVALTEMRKLARLSELETQLVSAVKDATAAAQLAAAVGGAAQNTSSAVRVVDVDPGLYLPTA